MNLKNGLSLRAQAQKTVSLGIPYSCVSRKQIWPIVTKSRAGVAGGWGGGAEQERNLGPMEMATQVCKSVTLHPNARSKWAPSVLCELYLTAADF